MLLEALAAALVGGAALWLVLQPVVAPGRRATPPVEPLDPEETPRGIALAALKEIDFDRETGKLSDSDYEYLKSKYTRAALDALRSESEDTSDGTTTISNAPKVRPLPTSRDQHPRCEACGPRPELDAIFCSHCGRRLDPASGQTTLSETTRTVSA